MPTTFYPRDLHKRSEKLAVTISNFKAKEIQRLSNFIVTIDKAITSWELKTKEAEQIEDYYDQSVRKAMCIRRIRCYMEERRMFMRYIEEIKKIHAVVPELRERELWYGEKERLKKFNKDFGHDVKIK